MKSEYSDLLLTWCRSMAALQIREISTRGVFGGLMCPACARIHGRSADAIHPLLWAARHTGEDRFRQAAWTC
jgi:hypothetical protein